MNPERLPRIVVDGDSVRSEVPLPTPHTRGASEAWITWRGITLEPIFVRFDDSHRSGRIPIEALQRIARSGPVWVDAGPTTGEDVLDLSFSGADMTVVWMHQAPMDELEDSLMGMEDGILLGWDEAESPTAAEAVASSRAHELPLLVQGSASAILAEVPDGERDIYLVGNQQIRRLRQGPGDEEE